MQTSYSLEINMEHACVDSVNILLPYLHLKLLQQWRTDPCDLCATGDVTYDDIETGRNLKPQSHNREALWPLSLHLAQCHWFHCFLAAQTPDPWNPPGVSNLTLNICIVSLRQTDSWYWQMFKILATKERVTPIPVIISTLLYVILVNWLIKSCKQWLHISSQLSVA